MNRVVHFETQADDPMRAISFYTKVFGWEITKWGEQDYWMVMTAPQESSEPGINGGLLPRPSEVPDGVMGANSFVCTVWVDDFDKVSEKITLSGGTVLTPKYALPGMAWQGYFTDTEGNTFGIHQTDKNAG